ncbi:MAG: type III pantothenate kinase [Prevotellaceae bacterium]|jgi:type III pantothenate kinase|nr:type III pantothenate kinase [Prevotellaceae bacterium]
MKKNLIIDIGNTACKAAYSVGKEIEPIFTKDGLNPLLYLQEVTTDEVFDTIVLSSVQERDSQLILWLKEKAGKLIVVDGDTPTVLRIDYQTPDRLGADRLAAGVGAVTQYPGKDLLVIDFGTAITYDFISKERQFMGGNISLGLQMRCKALHQFTYALPLILPSKDEEVPEYGIDTRGNIVAGVIWGIVHELEGYIAKNQDKTIIFTGGDALFFAQMLKTPIFVDCNLVFIGLAQIAQSYAEK